MLGRLLVCVLAALFPLAAHTTVPAPRPLHQMIDGRGGRYDADKFNNGGNAASRSPRPSGSDSRAHVEDVNVA